MSKILDLAKSFEQASKQEAKTIEETVQKDFTQLENAIKSELKKSEQSIVEDIHAAQERWRRTILKPYWISIGILASITLILLISMFFLGMKINNQIRELRKTQNNIEMLNNKTNGIQVSYCTRKDGKRVVCVAIDKRNTEQYGKNGEYREILTKR